jgi:hypothetical protein
MIQVSTLRGDCHFADRAAVVLDLYAGVFAGEPLGEDDYVLCSDEKTSVKARYRCHPTLPPCDLSVVKPREMSQAGSVPRYQTARHTSRVLIS